MYPNKSLVPTAALTEVTQPTERGMKLLIAYASGHGSTAEVADFIGILAILREVQDRISG